MIINHHTEKYLICSLYGIITDGCANYLHDEYCCKHSRKSYMIEMVMSFNMWTDCLVTVTIIELYINMEIFDTRAHTWSGKYFKLMIIVLCGQSIGTDIIVINPDQSDHYLFGLNITRVQTKEFKGTLSLRIFSSIMWSWFSDP